MRYALQAVYLGAERQKADRLAVCLLAGVRPKYCHASPTMDEDKLHRAILESINIFVLAGQGLGTELLDLAGLVRQGGSADGIDPLALRRRLEARPFTTAFVTGNHENFDVLQKYPLEKWRGGSIRRIRHSVILLERGQIFTLGGKRFFTMGGARSHDIQDGILEPDNPLLKKKCRELDARDVMYRMNHRSWWKEELPSEVEYQTARASLDRAGWEVDYIITHCCPSSVQDIFSGGLYQKDPLTEFFDEIR